MELDNTITINNLNINSYIWGFIDSKLGKLILYSKNISNKIENNYQDYLKKDAPNKINIDNKFNIHFNKKKEFSETTDTSFQSVFRENISKVDPIITIMKSVYFNENFNQDLSAWNVENVTYCVDFSYNTPQWTLPQPNFTNCNPN